MHYRYDKKRNKFSTEYKKQKVIETFDNDWYEFVEYGSANKLTILLQRNGFSSKKHGFVYSFAILGYFQYAEYPHRIDF